MADDRDRNPRFTFGSDDGDDRRGARRRPGMGRLLTVLGVLAVVAGAAAYAWLYHPEAVRGLVGDTPLAPPPTTTRVYKWQGPAGDWNITQQPPPEGVPYEVLEVRGDTNVMPLVPPQED